MIRLGWHSSDLYATHPVARNLMPFFEHRDRSHFEHFIYSDARGPDGTSQWFSDNAAKWEDVSRWPDRQIVEKIKADRIDIMIYLAGRFDHNRLHLAAWKPAPINVSMFDSQTSGLKNMDYFVIDRLMAPRASRERFTERLLRLPNSYVHPPIENAPAVSPPPCWATGYPTFGCFNNPVKITPKVLALWGQLLDQIPTARLMLRYKNLYAAPDLRRRILAGLENIDPSRLDLGGADVDIRQHLEHYTRVDIALDTFHINGSTTTFEALHQGVPVISLWGDSVISRWTGAMLKRVGLDACIASTPEGYIERARYFADDWAALMTWRQTLRARLTGSALCNGAATTRYFERAMWAIYRRGPLAKELIERRIA